MLLLLEKAIKYAEDVCNGKEITTTYVKKQCAMFLKDVRGENEKYIIDHDLLEKIEKLLKIMNMPTGFNKGEKVFDALAGFQCLVITAIFGVKLKSDITRRRYKTFTLFIPRKNGKNFLVSVILLLCLLLEDDYTEMYSISLDRDLASMTKKALTQLIERSPLLKNKFKLTTTLNAKITCKINKSFFQARTSFADKNNSIMPSVIVEDEIGAMQSYSNLNAIESGQLNIKNPLILKISTAYENNNSVMEEEVNYSKQVLDGIVEDERIFSLLYYASKENIWNDTGIYEANPLRIEDNYNEIRDMRKKAQVIKDKKVEFLTKHCNVFLQEDSDEAYIDMEFWKKSVVDKIDFTGKEVVIALDGSISYDLFAVTIGYKEDNKYYMKSHAFLPSGTLNKRREKIDYKEMERREYCTIHNADTVQYNLVEEYIRNIEKNLGCKIKAIVSDPYCMKQTMESLARDYTVISLTQSYNNLTVATTECRNEVYNGNLYHEKNKLYDWCVANTTLSEGKSGHIMVAKDKAKKNKKRIDMCATSVMVMTQLINKKKRDYNKLFNENYIC